MFCANCFSVCPAMPIADPDNDGVSIWVGGKGANLAEMTRLGVPVPPGFTITTEVCRHHLIAEI